MTNNRFATNYVAAIQAFLVAWDAIRALDRIYVKEGLSSSLQASDMPPNLTVAQFVSAAGSWETVDSFIDTNNHFTNFYRLLP